MNAEAIPLAERRFPTRHFPYRANCGHTGLDVQTDPLRDIVAGSVVRFFLGADDAPLIIAPGTIGDHVADPFAMLILAAGHRPVTLIDLLSMLDRDVSSTSVPGQRVYRIADGGQIAWSDETAQLDRHLRLGHLEEWRFQREAGRLEG